MPTSIVYDRQRDIQRTLEFLTYRECQAQTEHNILVRSTTILYKTKRNIVSCHCLIIQLKDGRASKSGGFREKKTVGLAALYVSMTCLGTHLR